MRIANLEEIVAILKTKLPEYLESKGIDTSKAFHCINPNHKDEHPSARVNFKVGGTYLKCFSCNAQADIFAAATHLEGLPSFGQDWIEGNVLYLAKKHGLEILETDISEKDRYLSLIYRAYQQVSSYLVAEKKDLVTKDIQEYISSRKWKNEDLAEYGIGVGSREGLLNYMITLGYDSEYLRDINLVSDTAQVIEENRLIFTLYSQTGKVVGFSARCFDKNLPKFITTTSNGLKYPISTKGEALYGLSFGQPRKNTSGPIYIFEGYSDVITANMAGFQNTCALQGTFLTDTQLNILNKLKIKDIILALDFDEAGQQGTEKILSETLSQSRDIHISILKPSPTYSCIDPSEIIEQQSLNDFLALQKQNAFGWLLERKIRNGITGPNLANRMIPTVAAEPNAITREVCVRDLSKASGISTYSLDTEINKILSNAAHKLDQEEKALIEETYLTMERFPTERTKLLQDLVRNIESTKDKYSAGQFSASSCIALLDMEKEAGDTADPNKTVGFKWPLLQELADTMSGGKDWSYDTLMMVGAPENAGKSSLMSFLSASIAFAEENDVVTIYFSIDDSARDILPKFVSSMNCLLQNCIPTTLEDELLIGSIINPSNWVKSHMLQEEQAKILLRRREEAFSHTRGLMANDRLVIKDASDGNNLTYVESVIRFYRDKYPSKRIFAVLDNTHNLADHASTETRDRYTRIADAMKMITTRYSVCFMTSVEYRKQQSGVKMGNKTLPSNDDIAESRAFKYRANWIAHIYNDMHSQPENFDTFHLHPKTKTPLPRLLLLIGKSKINGFKGLTVLDFFPGQSAFKWKKETEAKLEAKSFLEKRKKEEGDEEEDDENW